MRSYSQTRSKLQEKRAARDLGGSVQKGSGSSDFAKGDFRHIGHVRGECKFTTKKTYVLKKDEILKIKLEALQGGFEDWVLQVEFAGPIGSGHKFAVIDHPMFVEMWSVADKSKFGILSTTSMCQMGKSYQLKLNDLMAFTCLHVLTVAFIEDGELITGLKSPTYDVIPWETYLALRKNYLEKQE